MKRTLLFIAIFACLAGHIVSQSAQRKTITAFTERMQKIDGFVPLYINSDDGKIFIEISRFNKEFL